MRQTDRQTEVRQHHRLMPSLLGAEHHKCSQLVKLSLFRSYCLWFYDIAFWCNFSVSVRKKFSMCYYKCMKAFFGCRKYDNVTSMLLVLGLPSCDTIWHNAKVVFNSCLSAVDCSIVHIVYVYFYFLFSKLVFFYFLDFSFVILYYYFIISCLSWYGSMWSDANKLIDWLITTVLNSRHSYTE